MMKRGIFSLVLMLTLVTTVFAQDIADFGTAGGLVVIGQSLYKSQQDTASYVSVITSDEIERMNPETTADLISSSLGITFISYGAVGAVQSVQIRGSNSNQVQVYLDGILMNSAHMGMFDVNSIPVSLIDHIEIIRSGTGSLGKTHAVGGMINIVTKQGEKREKPFTAAVESGSFLPELYKEGSTETRNWIGLADSFKGDLTYSNTFDDLSLTAGLGGIIAQNNYTYESADSIRLRENADMWGMHANMSASYKVSEYTEVSVRNLTSYKYSRVPGSLSWVTPDAYQTDFITMTTAGYSNTGMLDGLLSLNLDGTYAFDRTYIDNDEDTHNKHRAEVSAGQVWELDESMKLKSGVSLSFDGIDSTKVGRRHRVTFGPYIGGSAYFSQGKISVHPLVRLDVTNDFGSAPSISLGSVYVLSDEMTLQVNLGYANRPPTFSDLYWPADPWSEGNPDLDPEKAWSVDTGVTYESGRTSYGGTIFIRDTRDLINWAENDFFVWTPTNIGHAFFLGTEQSLDISLSNYFSVSANYLLNYSWDLSEGNTFSSDVRIKSVRMHTLNTAVTYGSDNSSISVTGRYLGKNDSVDAAFILDAVINWYASDEYSLYAAVDNLLNARYELNAGYPMPGTKVRLGAKVNF